MKKLFIALAFLLSACGSHSNPEPTFLATPIAAPVEAAKVKTPRDGFMLETKSLYNYRKAEIAQLTPDEIQTRNANDIEEFMKFTPEVRVTGKTGAAVSSEEAQDIISATYSNPVVSPDVTRYQRPDVHIGYCFGRATFAHLALKKMGVQTSAIRKVWLVGPMKNGSVNWGFHVATAVYVENEGWRVLDTNLGEPLSVQAWFDRYSYMNTDRKLRIYFTEPARFGVTIPHYERVDLGLDLAEDVDWYQHYFFDLMKWFRETTLEDMGLARVKPATEAIAPSKTSLDDIYSKRESVP